MPQLPWRITGLSSSAGSPQPTGAGTQLNAFIDPGTAVLNVSPYFTHRSHRFTASGVWEFPFGQERKGLMGALLKGWSVAPMFVYQSGQPWLLPINTEIVGDPSILAASPAESRPFPSTRSAVTQPRLTPFEPRL